MKMSDKKLSVVIPCFNEVNFIEELIAAVEMNSSGVELEIVVIDDFSTDGSRELLLGVLRHKIHILCLHESNLGKGAALRTGFKAATGDFILVQDADLEYNPQEYGILLQPILDGKADVVFGSRFLSYGPRRVIYFWHKLGNNFLTFFSNLFTNLDLTDMETCYKLFKSEVIKSIDIKENRFGFEPEITAKISKLDIRIYEVGISYAGRTYADGKKIGWKDGIRALYCIVKYNLFA
jgi:glycosyltransferase involved in cell wall biosynthesis